MTDDTPQQQDCPPPRTREAVNCWLRKWSREAVVDGKEPLTGEDVERLIKANGGTAQELDLSGRDMRGANLWRANLQSAHLSDADLQGANLWRANLQSANLIEADLQGANLWDANLQDAHLWDADLQGANLLLANLQGAYLIGANLQGAHLLFANLQGADLRLANLQGTDIGGIQLSRETNLEGVIWHSGYVLPSEKQGDFDAVQSTYRSLKTWHQEHGLYSAAGEFHHREMVCQRKGNQQDFTNSLQKTRNPWRFLKSLFHAHWTSLATALVLAFYEQLFGYGERPWRVVRAAAAVVLGLALAYYLFGTFDKPGFINALYFSAVSFSALGYGSWAPEPQGWAEYMGVAESFLGVFTIVLFLVTFTRRMVR